MSNFYLEYAEFELKALYKNLNFINSGSIKKNSYTYYKIIGKRRIRKYMVIIFRSSITRSLNNAS